MIFVLDGDTIVEVTGFATLPAFVAALGLPATVDAAQDRNGVSTSFRSREDP